jgi:hypothetical protein
VGQLLHLVLNLPKPPNTLTLCCSTIQDDATVIPPDQVVVVVGLECGTLLLVDVRDEEVGRLHIDLPFFAREGCRCVIKEMGVMDVDEKFTKGFESLVVQ